MNLPPPSLRCMQTEAQGRFSSYVSCGKSATTNYLFSSQKTGYKSVAIKSRECTVEARESKNPVLAPLPYLINMTEAHATGGILHAPTVGPTK
jgi:hypothetical protein